MFGLPSRQGLVSVVLRLSSVGAKFLLLLFMARFMTLEEIGIYGLFVTTNLLTVYVVGFECHNFFNRELLARAPDDRRRVLGSQVRLYGLTYAVILPASMLYFAGGVLPWTVAPWFVAILVTSHVSMETHRILIVLTRPVAAFAVAAISHGLWVFVFIPLAYASPQMRTLPYLLGCWFMTSAVGACVGVYLAVGAIGPRRGQHGAEWSLVASAFRVGALFFVSTAFMLLSEWADRYFLQLFHGEATVGIYTVFAGVSRVVRDVVVTGFVATTWPALVDHYREGRLEQFTAARRQLMRQVVVGLAVLLPLLWLGIWVVLWIAAKPGLEHHLATYHVLLGVQCAYVISMVGHYALYAANRDRSIVVANGIAFAVNVGLNCLLVPEHGTLGAAAATGAAITALALIKVGLAASLSRRLAR